MPIKYEWTHNGHGIHIIGSGCITLQESLDTKKAIYKDPRFRDLKVQLADFSNIDSYIITPREVNAITELDLKAAKQNPHLKIAIVVNSKLLYGLARVYDIQMEQSKWEIQLFEDLAKAERWIQDQYPDEEN